MAFPSDIQFGGTFNLDTNQLTLVDQTDYTGNGTGWNGYFSVVNPLGTTIRAITAIPDVVQGGNDTISLSIGTAPIGTYIITLQLNDGVDTYDYVRYVPLLIVKPSVTLDFVANQFDSSVSVEDNTEYIQAEIEPTITRTITLTYPGNITYNPYPSYPTPLTTTAESLGVVYNQSLKDGLFINGKYIYSLESIAEYINADLFTVTLSVIDSKSITIDSAFDMNKIYSCLRSLKNKLDKAIKNNYVLADAYNSQYTKAIQLVEMIRESYAINNLTDCDAYITEFGSVTGCDINCDCDDTVSLLVPIALIQNVEVISNSSPSLTVTKTVKKNAGTGMFYNEFALDLSIGSEEVYDKLVFIDPLGDDETGVYGSPLFPFATFAKVNSLGSGNTVIVNPGSYSEDTPFNQNNKYHLIDSVISCTNGFDTRYSPVVTGTGDITCTTFIIDYGTTQNTNAKIKAKELDCQAILGTMNTSTVGNVVFEIDEIRCVYISTNKVLQFDADSKMLFVNSFIKQAASSGAVSLINLGTAATTPAVAVKRSQIEIQNALSGLAQVPTTVTSWVSFEDVVFYTANPTYLCLAFAGTLNAIVNTNNLSNKPFAAANVNSLASALTIYANTNYLLNN